MIVPHILFVFILLCIALFFRKDFLSAWAAALLVFVAVGVYSLSAQWLPAILIFFISAIAAKAVRKKLSGRLQDAKRARRDVFDVLPISCGVLSCLGISLYDPLSGYKTLLTVFSFGLADIFSSEFGPILSTQAIDLKYLKKVPHGTPGAVSVGGLIAGLLGSVLISLFYYVAGRSRSLGVVLNIALFGFGVNLIDSLLNRLLVDKPLKRKNELINGLSVAFAVLAGPISMI